MNSESVDLIYLDPPFNSNADYSAPIGSPASGAEFKDTWTLDDVKNEEHGLLAEDYPSLYAVISAAELSHSKGMKAYLIMMASRLIEIHRILKPNGSVYLHCDPTASHYLKLLMDCVFGKNKFVSEITWKRTFAHGDKMFGSLSDTILLYGGGVQNLSAVLVPHSKDYIKKFDKKDGRGKFQAITLTGPGTSSGESGAIWRNIDPSDSGRCWSVPKTGRYADFIGQKIIRGYLQIEGIHNRLNALDTANMIYWPNKEGGIPRLKQYYFQNDGKVPGNIWDDISPVSPKSKEHTGYPTQKPLKLLQRIILASSNMGDIVFDPFCGCATACVAAEIENRNWVGIDISPLAAKLVVDRIKTLQKPLLETVRQRYKEVYA